MNFRKKKLAKARRFGWKNEIFKLDFSYFLFPFCKYKKLMEYLDIFDFL